MILIAGMAAALPLLGAPQDTAAPAPALRGGELEKTTSLFVPGDEAALIARRSVRAALMPVPPSVPEAAEAGANPIDRFLLAAQLKDAPGSAQWAACSDSAFVRRVYLDLIGVVPTLEESARFLNDAALDKRAKLIDELLARKDDYADHWATFWEDALASTPNNSNGGMATHGNYAEFIHKAFAENRPYDVFVAQMLDPALPGYKKPEQGGTNGGTVRAHLVLNASRTDTLQTAAAVSQVFLGTAMKCATCHNHFENVEWPQTRFYGFASYFGAKGGDLEVVRCEVKSGKVIVPSFPFAIPGAPEGIPTGEDARMTRVSQLMIDPFNERFTGTAVNRLWKRYFGLGLIEPADDWRAEWPASNPALLAWMSDDLVKHGFDLKHAIRLIMTSRAYQAAYEPTLEEFFDIGEPRAPRFFRSPSLRRLTAEQLVDSVRVAMNQKLDPKARLLRASESTGLARSLGRAATRNEVVTGRSSETSVVQGLELLNGGEFAGLLKGPLVDKALACKGGAEVASLVYRSLLCREPSGAEAAAVAEYLGEKVTAEGVQDVLWSVVSGPEFQFIR
jgi:hypothetical protein